MKYISSPVALARNLVSTRMDELRSALPRAAAARAAISSVPWLPSNRDHLAPNYASDLGIRRSDDPRAFLHAVLQFLQIAPSSHEEVWSLERLMEGRLSNDSEFDDERIAAEFDALISFAGMWEQAGALSVALIEEQCVPQTYRALTYMGSALSALSDQRAQLVYGTAFHAIDADPATKAMSKIRLAAWRIKRGGDTRGGVAELDELSRLAKGWVAEHLIAPGDEATIIGVAGNLRALVAAREKNYKLARALLDDARAALQAGGVALIGEDQRRRYLVQNSVNIAQLLCRRGDYSTAVQHMRETVSWSFAHHEASVSEALAILAYTHYLDKDFGSAIDTSRRVEPLIVDEGAPSRLAMARKVHAVSLHASGQLDLADRVLNRIASDPIGIQLRSGRTE